MQLRRRAQTHKVGETVQNEYPLICPVCGDSLFQQDRTYRCGSSHSFDTARGGYINLLTVQKRHSKVPGDAKDMLLARRNFLERGFYMPICRDVAQCINRYADSSSPLVVDCGCGEGYYTDKIRELCSARCVGVDISKEAVRMCCPRNKEILWTVANISAIPLADGSADAVTAIFSLFHEKEYHRILKSGGIVAEVTAGSRHLIELKQHIYKEVFEQHKSPAPAGEGFETLELRDESFVISPGSEELASLLAMTPHSRRMSHSLREQAASLEGMDVTVNYIIRVLKKK